MPRKAKVEYTQNSEPAFIAEFKKRAGIVVEPTVESKRTALSLDQNEDGDRPDEQPQLVWTASSGVTEEEARNFLKQNTIKDPVKDTDHSGGEAARENAGVQVGPLPKPSKIRFVPRSEREESKRLNDQSPNRRSREETERDRSPITRTSSGQSKQGFLSFDMEEEEDDEN